MKRHRLANRYETVRQGIKVGGRTLYVDVGRDTDNVVRSVFIDTYKTGTESRALVEVIARLISLGLQYDVPLEKIIELLRGTKFKPAGIVVGDSRVRLASSPLDYLVKHLEDKCTPRTTAPSGLPSCPTAAARNGCMPGSARQPRNLT